MKVLFKNGYPLIYLPTQRAAARETLRLYPAQSRVARLVKRALDVALASGLPLPLKKSAPPWFDVQGEDWIQLPDIAGEVFSKKRMGVFAGNPRVEGRRFLYLLCNVKGKAVNVLKAGFDPSAVEKIRTERDFLKENAGKLGIPPLQGVLSSGKDLGFVIPFYRGRHPRSGADGCGIAAVMHSWAGEAKSVRLGDIGAWRKISHHSGFRELADRMVRPVMGHGDFVPWNILVDNAGAWHVIDWERGTSSWVPAWDWFHFVAQPLILVKKTKAEEVIRAVGNLIRSPEFKRYTEKTGINGIAWDLFRGYLVYAREVLGQSEGRETLAQLADWALGRSPHRSARNVVAVMQVPPPYHGQAIMNRYLLEGSYRNIRLRHVRMAFSAEIEEVGGFRWRKVAHLFRVLLGIIRARFATRAPVLYYAPAGPKMVPFLRDCVLLISTRWMFPRTAFHFHANGISDLYRTLPWVLKKAFRIAYRHPDLAIAISEYGRADAEFLDAREIRVIPNGVPDAAAGVFTRRSRPLEIPPLILFVGMVSEEKGVGVLLRTCFLLKERGIPFRCLIVGRAASAAEKHRFDQMIRDSGLQSQVTMTGVLAGQAKWEAYTAADVFCFPTFYSAESFGLVAVEAMMFSLPVVASDWRGVPDIVEAGRTGFLVAPRDADSLAHRLGQLLLDPSLREEMGKAGRRRYEELYTVESFRQRMEEALSDDASAEASFSIVTPSLDQLDWLRLCIASVADQVAPEEGAVDPGRMAEAVPGSPPDSGDLDNGRNPLSGALRVEHIIQDGGSRGLEDFVRNTAEELSARYPGTTIFPSEFPEMLHLRTPLGYTLRIFREKDDGMYDAINRGLAKSHADLCAWLNSDEQYVGGALRSVLGMFRSEPAAGVVLGDALLLDEELHPVCYRRIMKPEAWHTRLDHLHSLSCAMFFRRGALPSPPLDPRWKIIGDAVLMDHFLSSGKRIHVSNQLLAAYCFTGRNLSAAPTDELRIWWSERGWPPRFLRPLVVLFHRLRRLVNGAYSPRRFDCALWVRDGIPHRVEMKGTAKGIWFNPEH